MSHKTKDHPETKNGLHTKAMLVSLSISRWYGKASDKEVDRKVVTDAGASEGSYKGKKKLFPFAVPSFDAINNTASRIRRTHYALTLPWTDENWRMLPVAEYFHYMETIKKLKGEFEQHVYDFLPIFPQLKEMSKGHTGKLFKEEDWPSPEKIAKRFSIETKFKPIPADDFRVTAGMISDEELDGIYESVRSDNQEAFLEGNKALWRRLYEAVNRMATMLAKDDYGPHKSLIGNLKELCDLIPKMNLTDDDELEKIWLQVESQLTIYDRDQLKKGEVDRADAQVKAANIAAVMEAMMSRT